MYAALSRSPLYPPPLERTCEAFHGLPLRVREDRVDVGIAEPTFGDHGMETAVRAMVRHVQANQLDEPRPGVVDDGLPSSGATASFADSRRR